MSKLSSIEQLVQHYGKTGRLLSIAGATFLLISFGGIFYIGHKRFEEVKLLKRTLATLQDVTATHVDTVYKWRVDTIRSHIADTVYRRDRYVDTVVITRKDTVVVRDTMLVKRFRAQIEALKDSLEACKRRLSTPPRSTTDSIRSRQRP